jgi:hypothetical protein
MSPFERISIIKAELKTPIFGPLVRVDTDWSEEYGRRYFIPVNHTQHITILVKNNRCREYFINDKNQNVYSTTSSAELRKLLKKYFDEYKK